MLKYVTTSTSFWNKKLSGEHFFLPFKVANDVAQFANNNPNQLQTKINIRKQGPMKRYNHVKSYA
jgi:dihydroneopterin aldolase